MGLGEIMSALRLHVFAEIGLVVALGGWVAMLAALLGRRNGERFERARFMALEDAPRRPARQGGRDG
jgi:hypothetical protein